MPALQGHASERLEKPGIDPQKPGLQVRKRYHCITGASVVTGSEIVHVS